MSERFVYDFEDPEGHKILEDGETLSELTTCGEYRKITDRLNELYQEKKRFEFILNEAIKTERTELGKSVLKQLKEACEI